MPSPFPGMNPYLEHEFTWHDFHESFMPMARKQLTAQIAPRYFVKIEEHIFVHEIDESGRRLVGRGDVLIGQSAPISVQESTTATLAAPAQVWRVAVERESVAYLEVRDKEDEKLVTVIELISPSNKLAGGDRDSYLKKRDELLDSEVHFIEIDLLRGGPRLPWREMPECDYYALVSRAADRPRADIWPIRLRDRLPEIPVPLRAGDAEAKLDLQLALHQVYDEARYGDYIYRRTLSPRLRPEDARWTEEILGAVN